MQTAPYALIVAGNALAPTLTDGQTVKVTPVGAVLPGSIALLAVNGTPGLYRINADGDATAGRSIVERDCYLLLGIVEAL